MPFPWKVANAVLIPKSGTSSEASNYRPISLLSVVSKVLEKQYYHLHCWPLRKALSTIQHPVGLPAPQIHCHCPYIDLAQTVQHFAQQKQNSGNFFNLQKAFDTVPHRPLLDRLKDCNLPQQSCLDSRLSFPQSADGCSGISCVNALTRNLWRPSRIHHRPSRIYHIYELYLSSPSHQFLTLYAYDMSLFKTVTNLADLEETHRMMSIKVMGRH